MSGGLRGSKLSIGREMAALSMSSLKREMVFLSIEVGLVFDLVVRGSPLPS